MRGGAPRQAAGPRPRRWGPRSGPRPGGRRPRHRRRRVRHAAPRPPPDVHPRSRGPGRRHRARRPHPQHRAGARPGDREVHAPATGQQRASANKAADAALKELRLANQERATLEGQALKAEAHLAELRAKQSVNGARVAAANQSLRKANALLSQLSAGASAAAEPELAATQMELDGDGDSGDGADIGGADIPVGQGTVTPEGAAAPPPPDEASLMADDTLASVRSKLSEEELAAIDDAHRRGRARERSRSPRAADEAARNILIVKGLCGKISEQVRAAVPAPAGPLSAPPAALSPGVAAQLG